MKSIVIEIKPGGETKIEAIGFNGGACEKATAAIEAALGTVTTRNKKPDYYVQDTVHQKVGGK